MSSVGYTRIYRGRIAPAQVVTLGIDVLMTRILYMSGAIRVGCARSLGRRERKWRRVSSGLAGLTSDPASNTVLFSDVLFVRFWGEVVLCHGAGGFVLCFCVGGRRQTGILGEALLYFRTSLLFKIQKKKMENSPLVRFGKSGWTTKKEMASTLCPV